MTSQLQPVKLYISVRWLHCLWDDLGAVAACGAKCVIVRGVQCLSGTNNPITGCSWVNLILGQLKFRWTRKTTLPILSYGNSWWSWRRLGLVKGLMRWHNRNELGNMRSPWRQELVMSSCSQSWEKWCSKGSTLEQMQWNCSQITRNGEHFLGAEISLLSSLAEQSLVEMAMFPKHQELLKRLHHYKQHCAAKPSIARLMLSFNPSRKPQAANKNSFKSQRTDILEKNPPVPTLLVQSPKEGSDPQHMSHRSLGNTISPISHTAHVHRPTSRDFSGRRKWECKSRKGGRWRVCRKSHEQPDLLCHHNPAFSSSCCSETGVLIPIPAVPAPFSVCPSHSPNPPALLPAFLSPSIDLLISSSQKDKLPSPHLCPGVSAVSHHTLRSTTFLSPFYPHHLLTSTESCSLTPQTHFSWQCHSSKLATALGGTFPKIKKSVKSKTQASSLPIRGKLSHLYK